MLSRGGICPDGRFKKGIDSIDRREAANRIDNYIEDFDDWRGERLAELRKIIHEVNLP